MQRASQTRLPGSIRILCEAAREFGISPEQCLENTGLKSFDLYNSDTRVTIAQELEAIANFLRHAPYRPGLGIEVGRRYRPEVFGVWGYAILSSPTLRVSLKTASDYSNLSFIIATMRLDESGRRPKVTFDTAGLSTQAKSFVLERHLTVLDNFAKILMPDLPFRQFEFRTTVTDPEFAQALRRELGLRVSLNESVDAFVLPARVLDRPLPQHDPAVMADCLQQCRNLLNQKDETHADWTSRVRDVTLPEINNNPHIGQIASKLGVSERTLCRRLSEEGTSFREILVQARLAIAHELLKTTKLNVSSVAWRTGYSEPSSFVRAFSKIYGHPPGALTGKNV